MSWIRSAVVQGASRGIGLEYTRQLLLGSTKCPLVFATCRNPNSAAQLQSLKSEIESSSASTNQTSKLHILSVDLNDENSIENASTEVKSFLGGKKLDLLINNSGILHSSDIDMKPERSLNDINTQFLNIAFNTHCVGPLLMYKYFSSLMKRQPTLTNINSSDTSDESIDSNNNLSVIVNMSARLSSITDNRLGGWYTYRATKSALNQITKTASIELKRQNIITYCLHPGTVDTQLTKPFQSSINPDTLFTVEQSVEKLLNIIQNSDETMNGCFFFFFKKVIRW